MDVEHFTQLVVDEMSIIPLNEENLKFTWSTDKKERENQVIYVSTFVDIKKISEKFPALKNKQIYQKPIEGKRMNLQFSITYYRCFIFSSIPWKFL